MTPATVSTCVRLSPALLVLLPLAAGCLGGSSTTTHSTLRIAFGPDDGSPGLVTYHLSCSPDSGTVAAPVSACASLADRPKLTSPPPSSIMCGGTLGAWSVTITGTYRGDPVHAHYGTCAGSQVYQWMQIAHYTPCPGNFEVFTCTHGPYAFGKGHMRGLHLSVPNVVGMTATQAAKTLRRRGLETAFITPAGKHDSHLVAAQAPRPGTSADVYQVVKLTLNRGCGFC
jgi:PASTA domain